MRVESYAISQAVGRDEELEPARSAEQPAGFPVTAQQWAGFVEDAFFGDSPNTSGTSRTL